MPINYTQSFQSGELSRKMDGRAESDQYKTGCRKLDNFYVLPQGGVERRSGTEFIALTGAKGSEDGTNPSRLFPFDFSATVKFIIQISSGNIKIFDAINNDSSGSLLTYAPTGITVPSYSETQLNELQFVRRYDTMIITHRDFEPLVLRRVTEEPTFTIENIDFIYPPLMDMNFTTTSLKPNSSVLPTISVALNTYNSVTGALKLDATAHGLAVNDRVTITGVTHSSGSVTITDTVVTVSNANDFTIVISTSLSSVAVSSGLVTKIITQIQTYSDDATTLVSNIINNDHVNSTWGINYARASTTRSIAIDISSATNSSLLDVSFGNYVINIRKKTSTDELTGTVILERDTGSGFEDFVILGTADGSSNSSTMSFSSTLAEDKNTQIRIKVSPFTSGGIEGEIVSQDRFQKGLVKITSNILGSTVTLASASDYDNSSGAATLVSTGIQAKGLANGDTVTITGITKTSNGSAITVSNQAVSSVTTNGFTVNVGASHTAISLSNAIIYSSSRVNAEVLSTLGDNTATIFWQEAEFSNYRKFPIAAEFYQNRLFFTGSKDDPATIFGSVFNDIFNFLTGSTSDMSIKRIPDTAAEAKSLIGKKDLFMGTDGGIVSIKSVNSDQLISQTNISTEIQNSYGSSLVQPVLANDVVVYLQGNKLKLRELVYSRDNDVFVGNDLNILSEDITGTGVKQMFVQKNPDQIIWCIKEDGTACILSYDRTKQLMGWSNITTTGTIVSGTILTTSNEDEIFLCVKRDSKFCIEKFKNRSDLTWYVDSGKELNGGAGKSITDIAIAVGKITFTSTSHGLSDGDLIQINNTDSNQLNEMTYKISDSTTNTFKIKDIELTDYIFYDNTNDIVVSDSTVNANFNGTYERKLNSNGDVFWQNKNFPSLKVEIQEFPALPPASNTFSWHLTGGVNGEITFTLGGTQTSKTNLLKNLWWDISYDNTTFKKAFVNSTFKSEAKGEVIQVYNEISSLDHINGQTAQVLGNNSFIKETTVTNNKITLDDYYNKIVVGLKYISTLQPMPIEPALSNRLSQSRVKAVAKMVIRFLNTKGASVGEAGRQLTNFPVVKTTDETGTVIPLKTDSFRFFVGSDYEREKLLEIKQNLPYPMTVLSVASNVNVEGA